MLKNLDFATSVLTLAAVIPAATIALDATFLNIYPVSSEGQPYFWTFSILFTLAAVFLEMPRWNIAKRRRQVVPNWGRDAIAILGTFFLAFVMFFVASEISKFWHPELPWAVLLGLIAALNIALFGWFFSLLAFRAHFVHTVKE
ncbi:MAG: hypothetical protein WD711_07285 [Dongiaceae bacterium]